MNDRNLLYIHLFKIILEWSWKLQLTNKIILEPVISSMIHAQYYDLIRYLRIWWSVTVAKDWRKYELRELRGKVEVK